jgi:hypothetical protein
MTHHVELEIEDENGWMLVQGEVIDDPGDYHTPGYQEAKIHSVTDEDGADIELSSHDVERIESRMLEYCGIYL